MLDKNDDGPLDPGMLKHITQSMFFFAPALDLPVFAEVVCAGKPALLLSEDPLEDLAYPTLVNFSCVSLEWILALTHGSASSSHRAL
jgi:hypothetical protein